MWEILGMYKVLWLMFDWLTERLTDLVVYVFSETRRQRSRWTVVWPVVPPAAQRAVWSLISSHVRVHSARRSPSSQQHDVIAPATTSSIPMLQLLQPSNTLNNIAYFTLALVLRASNILSSGTNNVPMTHWCSHAWLNERQLWASVEEMSIESLFAVYQFV